MEWDGKAGKLREVRSRVFRGLVVRFQFHEARDARRTRAYRPPTRNRHELVARCPRKCVKERDNLRQESQHVSWPQPATAVTLEPAWGGSLKPRAQSAFRPPWSGM